MALLLRRRSLARAAANPHTDTARGAGRGGLVFFLATVALNGTNFGFQIFVSRVLGPHTYSALSALLSLLVIAGVPLSALQLSCAAAQARLDGSADPGRVLRLVAAASAAAGLLVLLSQRGVDGFLQIQSVWPLFWLCVWLVVAAVAAVPQGLLIGQGRFAVLGVTALLGAGVGRLVFGVAAAGLDLGVAGGMAATALGQAVTLVLLLAAVRARGPGARPSLRLSAADGALSTAALTGLAVFSAVDTVLARHTLDNVQSGYYAAAATGGRIALFAPGAVAVLAFPRFVRAAEQGGSDRRDLLVALAAVAGVGLLVVLVVTAVPRLVIDVLFGSDYALAAHQLTLLAPAGALLGCLTLATYYHLARGSGFALASWVGAAAVAGAEARVRLIGDDLATTVLLIVAVLTVASVGWALAAQTPLSPARQAGTGRRGTATAAAAVLGGETGAVVSPGVARENEW